MVNLIFGHQTEEQRFYDLLRRRSLYLTILIILSFLTLLVRLWHLQFVQQSELLKLAENNRVREVILPGYRGKIFDRNGIEIINSRPSFNLALVPEDIPNLDKTFDLIERRVPLDPDKIRDLVKRTQSFQTVVMKRDVDRPQVAYVEERSYDLPGVFLTIEPLRNYKYGTTASHLLGYLGEITRSQLDGSTGDYRPGDTIGQAGIEGRYEEYLRGIKGKKHIEVNATGRELEVLDFVSPKSGKDLYLTVDLKTQLTAEQAMEGRQGSIVALDPQTGEVLAYVNKPAFDPNRFAGGVDPNYWSELVNNSYNPLQNRAIQGQYPPGSTFKLVVAAAALEERIISPETVFFCNGSFTLGSHTYRCWKKGGHGQVNLHKAIKESCDIYFYNVGLKVGIDNIANYAGKFGLGRKSGINLSGEKPGLIPTAAWKKRARKEKWILGETVSCSIGQGYDLVTPIQMARLTAAFANGGFLVKPIVIRKVESKGGPIVPKEEEEQVVSLGLKSTSIEAVREAMRAVVNEPGGTGSRCQIQGVEVAGKTGTSQVVRVPMSRESPDEEDLPPELRDHAWFIGFAPYDDPKIAVSVIVEHGGHGGVAAAPVAKQVIEEYLVGLGILSKKEAV